MKLTEARDVVVKAMSAVVTESETATVRQISYGVNRAVTKGKVVSFGRRTKLDVSCYSWCVQERGAVGRRTYYTWWLNDAVGQPTVWPAGSLTCHTVTGNQHGTTFQVLSETHLIEIEGVKLS